MATTMRLISKQTLSSSSSTITFSNIPGTGYTDLLLILSARSDRSNAYEDPVRLRFNSDTGNNYTTVQLAQYNSSAFSGSITSSGIQATGALTGPLATSSTFGSGAIYIPNYAGSTNKSLSCDCTTEHNGTQVLIGVSAGLWSNTAAITTIEVAPWNGSNLVSGSSFFLYGITKA